MAESQIDSGADISGDAVADTGLQSLGRHTVRRGSGEPPMPTATVPSTVTYPSLTIYPGA
jgi:hypothetical protein